MGLALSSLRFLVRQHLRKPFGGAVCLLGRQCVYAKPIDVLNMMREEGFKPSMQGFNLTNIPAWKNEAPYNSFISDETFFRMLGADSVTALDVSDYEGADIVQDLATPIPHQLEGRFDLVIDGGTLEHVYDIRQAMVNVNRMLKSGGRVIHFSPASNYIDHGYYQLSPIFFLDYYTINKFEDCDIWLCEHVRPFASIQRWKIYEYKPNTTIAPFSWLKSNKAWATFVVAKKDGQSTSDVIPIQGRVKQYKMENKEQANPLLNHERLSSLRKRFEPFLRRNPILWWWSVRIVMFGLYLLRRHPIQYKYKGKL